MERRRLDDGSVALQCMRIAVYLMTLGAFQKASIDRGKATASALQTCLVSANPKLDR
jgi:hypothetical protein